MVRGTPERHRHRADAGTSQRAETPRTMEDGHHRTPLSAFDGDGLSVHGHFQGPLEEAPQHEYEEEGDETPSHPEQGAGQAVPDHAGAQHVSAAQARDQITGG